MNTRASIIGTILALLGLGMAGVSGSKLLDSGAFTFTPNPLGIKRSPYGEVMAMAVQGGFDRDFNFVMFSDASSTDLADPTEREKEKPTDPSKLPFIERLNAIADQRTNPKPPSPAHTRYLRRQIENRLRFAYELDPSHYGNYNSYHLFLTEPQLGTSKQSFREGRDRADELAEETMHYCLQIDSTPGPALTAATAAYNILESMFYFKEDYTLEEMAKQIRVIDYFLNRFHRLLDQAEKNGTWDRLSPTKQNELLNRAKFTQKLRDTLYQALARLARQRRQHAPSSPPAKNHD